MKCNICHRETPDQYIQEHHLIPKSKRGKETVPLCKPCHNQLHKMFTNNELRDQLYTIDLLLENEKVKNWTRWIKKRKDTFKVCMKTKKKR